MFACIWQLKTVDMILILFTVEKEKSKSNLALNLLRSFTTIDYNTTKDNYTTASKCMQDESRTADGSLEMIERQKLFHNLIRNKFPYPFALGFPFFPFWGDANWGVVEEVISFFFGALFTSG